MTRLASAPDEALTHYEALRREALATTPVGPRGHGLALFVTRGMAAWLTALAALGPRRGLPRSRPRRVGGRGRSCRPSARS